MIRIVHVISDLDTGGAEVMLAKLVSGMDRTRFTNAVVSLTDRGQLGEQIESSGVAVHTLGMRRGRPDVSALPTLIRLIRDFTPTIVQSWLYHADLLSTVAVKLSGHPFLLWNVRCSDMDLTRYRALTRWTQRVLAWWSATPAAVVINSEAGKREHEWLGYHPRRWAIIPNGFDTERFRPDSSVRVSLRREWQLSEDTVVVGLVARVDPMKDHGTFLSAARQIIEAGRKVCFLLIGRGTPNLASAVAEKGLTSQFRLLGHRSDVEGLLPGIDILCLSSAFGEGFPNVLGEAMSAGVPCVATDVGDAREIIGPAGLIVPPQDPDALAKALLDLVVRGREERIRLGLLARQRIEEKYSLAKVVKQYQELYGEIVQGAVA